MHVLFVCTGNICRSPTAERLAAAYAEQMALSGFVASSAGTRAVISQPIHQEAARVLEGLGGNATDFSARQLSARIANSSDLILTMTRAHRDRVLELAPNRLKRTFTLAEASRLATSHGAETVDDLALLRGEMAADERLDIMDPIGHGPQVFISVGQIIADLLPPVLGLTLRPTGQNL
ncbi:arsenate reductase/protein-tyrosine-phosphatase family protein [Mycobacterium sp. 4D054]|uniref:arsenate reductase/protein-tyrosine-phosphatase family protein n=1 Tax=Mycobacterium sp. 4D054 TaxID=3457440 RepID=UPI003FD49304